MAAMRASISFRASADYASLRSIILRVSEADWSIRVVMRSSTAWISLSKDLLCRPAIHPRNEGRASRRCRTTHTNPDKSFAMLAKLSVLRASFRAPAMSLGPSFSSLVSWLNGGSVLDREIHAVEHRMVTRIEKSASKTRRTIKRSEASSADARKEMLARMDAMQASSEASFS
jgi:hypothetical protein